MNRIFRTMMTNTMYMPMCMCRVCYAQKCGPTLSPD